jgi:hypothetical protein
MSITNGLLRLLAKEIYLYVSHGHHVIVFHYIENYHDKNCIILKYLLRHKIFGNAVDTLTSEVNTPATLVLFMV